MLKTDRRVERTQQLLTDALVALILKKGYEAVTIKDITERANVAYVTFFRHYKDIDELLVNMLETVVAELAGLMQETEQAYSTEVHTEEGYHIFKHAQANSQLYSILLSSPGASKIVKRVKSAIAASIRAKCEIRFHEGSLIPVEIFANHAAASLLALIEWWLEQDMPYPPEHMAKIYDQLIVKASWDAVLPATGL